MSVSKGLMLFVFYVAMDNPPFIGTGTNLRTGQTGKGQQKLTYIND